MPRSRLPPSIEPPRACDPRERRAQRNRHRVPGQQMERLVDGAGDAHRRGCEQEGPGARAHPHDRGIEWGTTAHSHEERGPRDRGVSEDADHAHSSARHEGPGGTDGHDRLERREGHRCRAEQQQNRHRQPSAPHPGHRATQRHRRCHGPSDHQRSHLEEEERLTKVIAQVLAQAELDGDTERQRLQGEPEGQPRVRRPERTHRPGVGDELGDQALVRRRRLHPSASEEAPQRRVRPVGAHAERPGCRPDSRGCRLGREALELHELDRLAVGRRQSIERLRKLQPGVPALRHRLLGEDADENLPADPDAAPAQVPSHDVRRDRKQPGLDGPRGLVGVARTVQREEGLLDDVRAFIDIFTDVSGLFVINNESGWYEGWMIHDLTVAPVNDTPRSDGHAQFGTILQADADALSGMGAHHDVPGNIFTSDGNAEHFPGPDDRFPDSQTNVVPIQLSMGAWNTLQQSDGHAYWEFNYTTNWIHPLYELPFTGGIPGTFEAGQVGTLQSIVTGSGPSGIHNDAVQYGDNPNNKGVLQASGPRDPDKFDADDDAQREFRQRFIPSGLANEIFLDVYERLTSFEPGVSDFKKRLFDAYAAEVARVDTNNDGVISAAEGEVDTASDGFADNSRLFIPATQFKRFAVTREINDGLLAPRFAPSQKAWVLSGTLVSVSPSVPASQGEDSDDR